MILSWRTISGKPPAKASGFTELHPVTLRLVRGPDAVLLRIGWRLGFARGSWFLDQRLGVPYYQQILARNPSRALITQIMRDTIRTTPGVAEIISLALALDPAKRSASLDFEARLDDGDTVIRAVDAPLLLRRA